MASTRKRGRSPDPVTHASPETGDAAAAQGKKARRTDAPAAEPTLAELLERSDCGSRDLLRYLRGMSTRHSAEVTDAAGTALTWLEEALASASKGLSVASTPGLAALVWRVLTKVLTRATTPARMLHRAALVCERVLFASHLGIARQSAWAGRLLAHAVTAMGPAMRHTTALALAERLADPESAIPTTSALAHLIHTIACGVDPCECPALVPALVRRLCRHGSPRVRRAALTATGILQQRRVPATHDVAWVALARGALYDDTEQVRRAAMPLLWRLAQWFPEHDIAVPSAPSGHARLADYVCSELCRAVTDPAVAVRAQACELLGSLHAASPQLLIQMLDKKLLRTTDQPQRRSKQHNNMLRPYGDAEVVDELRLLDQGATGAFVYALEDEFHVVRHACIDALCELAARCPPLGAVAPLFLVDMFNDAIESVRLNALLSLRRIVSHIRLNRHQLHTLLINLGDASHAVRRATYALLAAMDFQGTSLTRDVVAALTRVVAAQPGDWPAVFRCLAGVAANNAHSVAYLTESMLRVNPAFLTTQDHPDDMAYAATLICVVHAADADPTGSVAAVLPPHILKHVRYLSDKYPGAFPDNFVSQWGATALAVVAPHASRALQACSPHASLWDWPPQPTVASATTAASAETRMEIDADLGEGEARGSLGTRISGALAALPALITEGALEPALATLASVAALCGSGETASAAAWSVVLDAWSVHVRRLAQVHRATCSGGMDADTWAGIAQDMTTAATTIATRVHGQTPASRLANTAMLLVARCAALCATSDDPRARTAALCRVRTLTEHCTRTAVRHALEVPPIVAAATAAVASAEQDLAEAAAAAVRRHRPLFAIALDRRIAAAEATVLAPAPNPKAPIRFAAALPVEVPLRATLHHVPRPRDLFVQAEVPGMGPSWTRVSASKTQQIGHHAWRIRATLRIDCGRPWSAPAPIRLSVVQRVPGEHGTPWAWVPLHSQAIEFWVLPTV